MKISVKRKERSSGKKTSEGKNKQKQNGKRYIRIHGERNSIRKVSPPATLDEISFFRLKTELE